MKNIKFVPVAPKTFQVVELKEQQIKKSPLSAAARSKVVQSYGGNYVSERINDLVPTYGPCNDYNCTHTFYLRLTIGYKGF